MCVVSPILLVLLLWAGVMFDKDAGIPSLKEKELDYIDADYEVIDEDV